MRYPKFLEKGQLVGVPAPSFGAAIEPYKAAFARTRQVLAREGYTVLAGVNVAQNSGIGISSTPRSCGEELTAFYCGTDTQALISCGGGELMCESMNFVDFDRIAAVPPKWFMGYSDNTNFTMPLATMCHTASIYGPCAPTFGMDPWHQSLRDALDVLTGATANTDSEGVLRIKVGSYPAYEAQSLKDEDHPYAPYNCTEPAVRRVFVEGETYVGNGSAHMQGRLLGGCLDILCMQVGTRFDHVVEFAEHYADDGIIWFIESCDLNPMAMRRALWQMESAGWFTHVKGFLVGRPLCGPGDFMGLTPYDAVCGILGKYGAPIIMDADFGHIPPAMPLICGAYADISCEGNDIAIEYQLK